MRTFCEMSNICHLCVRNLLTNLDFCIFIGFCRFIFVFPHVVPLLKATANLSQLRLSLLRGEILLPSHQT